MSHPPLVPPELWKRPPLRRSDEERQWHSALVGNKRHNGGGLWGNQVKIQGNTGIEWPLTFMAWRGSHLVCVCLWEREREPETKCWRDRHVSDKCVRDVSPPDATPTVGNTQMPITASVCVCMCVCVHTCICTNICCTSLHFKEQASQFCAATHGAIFSTWLPLVAAVEQTRHTETKVMVTADGAKPSCENRHVT